MVLLESAIYGDGRRIQSIAFHDLTAEPRKPGEFVWIALAEPALEELEEVASAFELHELPMEDARRGGQRPKVEDYSHFTFVVMQTVELADKLRVGEIHVFAGKDFLVSIWLGTNSNVEEVRRRAERDPEHLRLGPAFALYALMDDVVDSYFPVLDQIEREIESIEAKMFSGPLAGMGIRELYAAKQDLGILKHSASPLLEAISQITGSGGGLFAPAIREYFRDVYDHLLRIDQAINWGQDTVMTAITASLALSQLQDNQTTKRLASYAALIAVPTFIAGLYGMNFNHMPELDWLWGYPFSLALMAAADVWLYWRFKRVGWL